MNAATTVVDPLLPINYLLMADWAARRNR
jgi:hypothetical protein